MSVRFSVRTAWDLRESSFAATIRQARQTGEELLDLTVSNPTLCGFAYRGGELLRPLSVEASLRYDADPRGLRSAREAVAGYYDHHGATVDPDALLLTTGTSEAYSFLFRLLCNVDDEVLIARPGYPLFEFLADLSDVRLRYYPIFYDFGWWIDFAVLERQIGPRTRAILVVHPNNPTGHWTAGAERNKLRELCAQHGLALIVDEVFLDYPLATPEPSFAAEEAPVLTFVLSGLSKIAGLPQMKAAWLLTLGPEAERREALARLEVAADTFLSMNAPVQNALSAWLSGRSTIQNQILARIRKNLATAESAGIPMLRTDAGWSVVLRTPITARQLLADERTVVHPGHFYGMSERNRIIVSLLTPELFFAEGVARLARTVLETQR